MEDIRLIVDLVLALGVALAGGAVARRLGQPELLGYVLAGVVIGPNTPGLAADFDRVQLMANLGVAFLMFALGVEFSFNELQRVRRVALTTAAIQIPLTVLVGFGLGTAIGWDWRAALLLGGGFAISSSIVALKLFVARGEAESAQARVALGLGIVQDLSLVPMLALLPVLAGHGDDVLLSLLRSVGTATLALVVVAVVGARVVPIVLFWVARTESRELFLLTIVVIALGTAVAAHEVGLSLALGAFLAGLVVSESEFEGQVLAEIVPLRDVFATLFFVALGMLVEPGVVWTSLALIVGLTLALVGTKLLVVGGAYLAAGVNHRTATLAALAMAQIGEFTFVLAGDGLAEGIIDRDQYGLILEVALGSILLAPAVIRLGPSLVAVAEHLPGVAGQERAQAGPEHAADELSRHVIVCGYGRVGSALGEALARRGLGYSVIELNPATVRALRARGVPAYYGDAGSEALLLRAGVTRARALAVTSTDLVSARATVRHARRLNPGIDIVGRANSVGELETLRAVGADEVVQPEFEAGLEFVRHVLRRQGVSAAETGALVARRRAAYYEPEARRGITEEAG